MLIVLVILLLQVIQVVVGVSKDEGNWRGTNRVSNILPGNMMHLPNPYTEVCMHEWTGKKTVIAIVLSVQNMSDR